jgi:hypothetical protein
MRRKIEDYIGTKIEHLTIIEDLGMIGKRHYVLVQCDCKDKTIKKVRFDGLFAKTGHTTSCGCYQREVAGIINLRHGGYKSKEFSTWHSMLQRCLNPNSHYYHRYGGRGIKVCEEWKDFANFIKDMGKAPSKKHSIDRINNDKGYFPENCRWVGSQKIQSNNMSRNRHLTYNGKTQTIAQWADELGLDRSTVAHRLDDYKLPLDLVLKPKRQIKTASNKGVTHSISEWAKILNVTRRVMEGKIKRGWPET